MLKAKPTLNDIQVYVAAVCQARGFDKESVEDSYIMLTEEVGELAKALRKHRCMTVATDSVVGDLAHEAADVLWLLVCVCNQLGIGLEQAVRDKEEKNRLRTWR